MLDMWAGHAKRSRLSPIQHHAWNPGYGSPWIALSAVVSRVLRSRPRNIRPSPALLHPRTLSRFLPAAALAALAAPALAVAFSIGLTSGSWNRPTATADGSAQGILTDAAGTTQFAFDATIVQQAVVFGVEFGTIDGVLDDGSGQAWPLYTMSGSYTGDPVNDSGTFNAQLARQASPSGPSVLIGRIGGLFQDDASPATIGTFKGRWLANL